MANLIKVTKKHSGYYNVYNAQTNEFMGHIENGKTTGFSDSSEWGAWDNNNEWIGTTSTKKELVSTFENMVLYPELY